MSACPWHNVPYGGSTMTAPLQDKLNIHVNVQISAFALQTIVGYAKNVAAKNSSGPCRIDTADWVSHMISRFLELKDFESFVQDESNYEM
jgi:hypothetical protein